MSLFFQPTLSAWFYHNIVDDQQLNYIWIIQNYFSEKNKIPVYEQIKLISREMADSAGEETCAR